MTKIILADSEQNFQLIADLAHAIWTEHYIPITGEASVTYMLNKFQSSSAIELQVKDNFNYYILEYNGTPVGYFAYRIEPDFLFLSKYYILKSYRGKGIGKIALSFIEAQAKKQNSKKIWLSVNKDNTNSINAYLKMGFQNVDERVLDIGEGHVMDDYILEKPLN